MSKDNLFLGMARGKVGDVVFTRLNGVQVARVRNRNPRNPRSPLQQLQRICFNTASKAYSLLQDICNHSFEGLAEGTANQAEFVRVNTEFLRSQLAYEITMPTDEIMLASTAYNYNQLGDTYAELNAYIVSRGSLPTQVYSTSQASMLLIFPEVVTFAAEIPTYAEVIQALGLQRGDQLTFLVVTRADSGVNPREFANAFHYARIILDPSEGDLNQPFLSGSSSRYAVNAPNPRNEGSVIFGTPTSSNLPIVTVNRASSATERYTLGAVIVSRYTNGRWLRSSQRLSWWGTPIPNADTFGDAYLTYQKSASSSLYLNQAD